MDTGRCAMGYALGRDLMDRYVPEARRYLGKAAKERRLVPYMEIANALGTGRGYIGQVLDELNRLEDAKGNPLISAIVVNAGANIASDGFFKLVAQLRPASSRVPKRQLWETERDLVWSTDWSA